jgi:histone acetyltransferase HTATIP
MNTTDDLSIDDIAQKTAITHQDVMNTFVYRTIFFVKKIINPHISIRCTTLQLFKHYKGQHIICLSDSIVERHQKAQKKKRRRIYPEHLIWKPPVFTRDQLRFGF